jgi:hypothetical protein
MIHCTRFFDDCARRSLSRRIAFTRFVSVSVTVVCALVAVPSTKEAFTSSTAFPFPLPRDPFSLWLVSFCLLSLSFWWRFGAMRLKNKPSHSMTHSRETQHYSVLSLEKINTIVLSLEKINTIVLSFPIFQ